MGEYHQLRHKGTAFTHSCVKVPRDPFSRQPTPFYERPKTRRHQQSTDSVCHSPSLSSARDELADFYENLPDHEEVQQLSNEQFKQKLDYLKRKQRMLLKNLRNCLEQDEAAAATATVTASATNLDRLSTTSARSPNNNSSSSNNINDLSLKGRRCNFEESLASRNNSMPSLLLSSARIDCLEDEADCLTHGRGKEREKSAKQRRNEKILLGKSDESPDSEAETKSLPPRSSDRWQPTVPKPFSFTAKEDAEKYMTQLEHQLEHDFWSPSRLSRKSPAKKRRIRRIPLTSKIPMYDKLCAEKEARSRFIREECALNLMSQVRPFKLECDRRAMRALTRSSPELRSIGSESCGGGGGGRKKSSSGTRFRAKPVPRHLLSSDVYDRMLEDEYFRNIQKRIRAAELLRSSSLPPSMARRDRCKSATSLLSSSIASKSPDDSQQANNKQSKTSSSGGGGEVASGRADTPLSSSLRAHSLAMTTASLPPHGNNIAAMLRAQASREKLAREIQERLEEKRREQMLRMRKTLIGRKPAWRALRSAARHEHERDMDFRASLRRDEAREQAERHRMQMEMMLDRVTRIPTLFERYSQDDDALTLQSFQNSLGLCPRLQDSFSFEPARYLHHHHHAHHHQQQQANSNNNNNNNNIGSSRRKKKTYNCGTSKHRSSSSADSYASLLSMSSERPNSVGSLTSSSPDYDARKLYSRLENNCGSSAKKRGPLRVSINEKAELIDDDHAANMTTHPHHHHHHQPHHHHHHHHPHQCVNKKDKERFVEAKRASSECLNSSGGPRLQQC